MKNPFFKNKGPFKINKLLKLSGIKNLNTFEKDIITNVNDLSNAKNNEITFFHSKNYEKYAKNTNASYCVTTNKLKNYLPKNCKKIITDNVILTMAKITKCFYPDSVHDYPDNSVKKIEEDLKNKERDIVAQKNILSNEEYSKKINNLRIKVRDYRNERQKSLDLLTKKRIEISQKFLKKINPLIAEYAKQNSISLIIQKKNIVMGKTELDITNAIMDLIDKNIKQID